MVEKGRHRSERQCSRHVVGNTSAANNSGKNEHRRPDLRRCRQQGSITLLRQIEANRRDASIAIGHRTTSPTQRKPCPVRDRNLSKLPSILALNPCVAFCVSPICPAARSIGLADMKQPFGARLARSCLRSRHWIAANRKRDGASLRVPQPV